MSEAAVTGNEAAIAVAPEFFVHDMEESLRFYRDKLGFRVVRQEPDFAVVALGSAFVLLAAAAAAVQYEMPGVKEWLAGAPQGIGVNMLIILGDVDVMYQRARSSGATIAKEIDDRDYGLRDFITADPDGYLLRFASPIEG